MTKPVFYSDEDLASYEAENYALVAPSKNQSFGFFGEIRGSHELPRPEVAKLWNAISIAIKRKLPKFEPVRIQKFLDSKAGRWLAENFYVNRKRDLKSLLTLIPRFVARLTPKYVEDWSAYSADDGLK